MVSINVDNLSFNHADVGTQLTPSSKTHDPYSANQGKELKESNQTGERRNFVAQTPSREPTIAPMIWSLILVGVGFPLCLLGLLNFDNERRLFATALLLAGLLLGALGILPWGMPS